mmetsp:Transcript_6806/g.10806  ORF Transcript_6806/g.10806 Transcript_6806/m.10806 type:complete len:594 (+) Transcript_6806:67-1848(+)
MARSIVSSRLVHAVLFKLLLPVAISHTVSPIIVDGDTSWKIPNWKTDAIQGICYSPVPKNIIPGETPWLYDSDMFNSDFQALWGIDTTPGVVSRDDLRYLRNALFNVIHLYDWNLQWYRNHQPFLDYAMELGMGVLIPVSNYVLTDGWEQRETLVAQLVQSTHSTETGKVHDAVFGWIVGNEYDTHQTDGPNGDPSIPVERVTEVMRLLAKYDPDPANRRPFTVPVSTAMGYHNNPGPGMGQLAEIRQAMLSGNLTDAYYNRYLPALNPFMAFGDLVELILDPYLEQSISWGEPPLPLIFTETGMSQEALDSHHKFTPVLGITGQAYYEQDMQKNFMLLELAKSPNPYNFSGHFFFEFTQEDWKGEGTPEMLYGLHALGDNISPILPTQKSGFWSEIAQTYLTKSHYPVNELLPTPAWQAVVSLPSNPFLLKLDKADASDIEVPCVVSDWEPAGADCQLYDWRRCAGFRVYTREILAQANANAPPCPTDLSHVVPCTLAGATCRFLGFSPAYAFGAALRGLLGTAVVLALVLALRLRRKWGGCLGRCLMSTLCAKCSGCGWGAMDGAKVSRYGSINDDRDECCVPIDDSAPMA